MDFKKFLVAGALSCSLAFSSFAVVNHQAYAVEFADTSGISGESSISKLVSLGVMRNPGDAFDPEAALTRSEFTFMVNQLMTLKPGSKKVVFKDLSVKNSAYTNMVKMVNNGFLTVDKGSIKPNKGVTNAEMGKFLSQGLGLKKTWTNRPIDYLFYLVRKDVLDIDTDLDAVVTREEAAVAFDKYITLKKQFKTHNGVVVAAGEKGFTLNTGDDFLKFTYASNASVFVSGQGASIDDVQIGSPATVILNKKGTVAYYGGELLDAEEGPLKLVNAKWNIGTMTKEVNLEAFVQSLPNNPTGEFSIKLIDEYLKNGAEFGAQAFFTDQDEVTAIYPYISKVTNKPITVSGRALTVTLAAAYKETLNIAEEATITLDGKEAKVEDLKGNLEATITADKFGNITSIVAVTKK